MKQENEVAHKNMFPLYPDLPEGGAEAAQTLIDKFKEALKRAADDAIGEMYSDIIPYIESDAWTNMRNMMMDGFKDYGNRKIQGDYDFAEIRKAIFRQFKDEIIDDLNQDMVKEIADLKKEINWMREHRT